jgi:hypothetical protein
MGHWSNEVSRHSDLGRLNDADARDGFNALASYAAAISSGSTPNISTGEAL